MRTVAKQDDKVKVSSSKLFTAIKNGDHTVEYQIFEKLDPSAYNLILIPIHLTGKIGHWSVIAIYPEVKSIFHLDSILADRTDVFDPVVHLLKRIYLNSGKSFKQSSWKFYQPWDMPKQSDSHSCGVLACLTAYNLTKNTSFLPYDNEITMMRYWIVKTCLDEVITLPERTGLQKKKVALPEPCEPLQPIRLLTNLIALNVYGKIFEIVSEKAFVSDDSILSDADTEDVKDDNEEGGKWSIDGPKEVVLEELLDNYLKSKSHINELKSIIRTPDDKSKHDIVHYYTKYSKKDVVTACNQSASSYCISFDERCEIGFRLREMMNFSSIGICIKTTVADFYADVVCPVFLCLFFQHKHGCTQLEAEKRVTQGELPWHDRILLEKSEHNMYLGMTTFNQMTIQAISGKNALQQRTHAVISLHNGEKSKRIGKHRGDDQNENVLYITDPPNYACRVLIQLKNVSIIDVIVQIMKECDRRQLISLSIPINDLLDEIINVVKMQCKSKFKYIRCIRLVVPDLTKNNANKIIELFK
ncbi:uncharacterized protein [Clytia hemisphaerica]